MRIIFNKYPVDIILCVLWSVILPPVILLDVALVPRIILGLPFILFIPGYTLIFALFPTRKTDRGIDIIDRIVLSFGFSIVVVPLIGLGLNYTPWGIRLDFILLSIFVFVVGVGTTAVYRWFRTAPDERFVISLDLSLTTSESKLDKVLTVILVISIILAVTTFVYVIVTPKQGEHFTEFYLLGVDHKSGEYPRNLNIGENATVFIGITNHEYRTINYTIEIWLISQTILYNETTKENETLYNHMWFMDKINVTLNHTSINIEDSWSPQWQYNYTFNIDKKEEDLKLAFLLFTTPTEDYSYNKDYKDIIEQKISEAYGETHLWINVT